MKRKEAGQEEEECQVGVTTQKNNCAGKRYLLVGLSLV
jgi:hypothetical protein